MPGGCRAHPSVRIGFPTAPDAPVRSWQAAAVSNRRVLALGLALAVGLVLLNATRDAGRTAPGTDIGGLAVGDLDLAGLRASLNRTVEREPELVTVVLGACVVRVRAHQLGFVVDVEATARRALRQSAQRRGLFGMARGSGRHVTAVVTAYSPDLAEMTARLLQQVRTGEASRSAPLTARGTVPTFTAAQITDGLRAAVATLPLPPRIVISAAARQNSQ